MIANMCIIPRRQWMVTASASPKTSPPSSVPSPVIAPPCHRNGSEPALERLHPTTVVPSAEMPNARLWKVLEVVANGLMISMFEDVAPKYGIAAEPLARWDETWGQAWLTSDQFTRMIFESLP